MAVIIPLSAHHWKGLFELNSPHPSRRRIAADACRSWLVALLAAPVELTSRLELLHEFDRGLAQGFRFTANLF